MAAEFEEEIIDEFDEENNDAVQYGPVQWWQAEGLEQCVNCGNIWDGYAQCNCWGDVWFHHQPAEQANNNAGADDGYDSE